MEAKKSKGGRAKGSKGETTNISILFVLGIDVSLVSFSLRETTFAAPIFEPFSEFFDDLW